VGGPKHAPLGGDRDGNLYWCFAGSDKLFVSAPPVRRHATTTAASTPKATSAAAAAATTLYIAVPPPPAALHNVGLSQPLIPPELSGCQVSAKFLEAGRKYISIGLEDVPATATDSAAPALVFSAPAMVRSHNAGGNPYNRTWWVYERPTDVGRLIRWLDPRDPDERLLRRTLTYLYPHAVALPADDDEAPEGGGHAAVDAAERALEAFCAQYAGAEEVEVGAADVAAADEEREAAVAEDDEDGEEEGDGANDSSASSSSSSSRRGRKPAAAVAVAPLPAGATAADVADKQAAAMAQALYHVGQKVQVASDAVDSLLDGRATVHDNDDEDDDEDGDKQGSGGLVWDATVAEVRAGCLRETAHIVFYRVRFHRWPVGYDSWVPEAALADASAAKSARQARVSARRGYAEATVYEPPATLQQLRASGYMQASNRACNAQGFRPPVTFSDCTTLLGQVTCNGLF